MSAHELVKRIRLSLGLSQMAFAQQMHVSFSTISRWENGHAQPNRLAIITLIDLCQKEQTCLELLPDLQVLSGNKSILS
ncbi:helix-turn-helix domain-containing protein [Anaerotruncus rubiinfantis]|uniref:helix-turn-helix domain-containing protein n=1 Tax=Anaerotruncus rubiinfantis TaxID=1720200 RepID=UPI0034A4D975